jgi:enhancing lycopene biosynthesis protein 2
MKKVAVVLSGCGVYDGSEIHEAVLTLLHLQKAGARVAFLAPNMPQMHVVNHLTGEVADSEERNVLVESARIARGQITDIAMANPDAFDACIFPGGFGAAKNLCDFAVKGSECEVQPDVLRFARAMAAQEKPLGFICIAPAMIPKIFGQGVSLTIGNDAETAAAIEAMGGVHVACPVDDFVVDKAHKIVSTPAYMLAGNILEAEAGISRLVEEVLAMA